DVFRFRGLSPGYHAGRAGHLLAGRRAALDHRAPDDGDSPPRRPEMVSLPQGAPASGSAGATAEVGADAIRIRTTARRATGHQSPQPRRAVGSRSPVAL